MITSFWKQVSLWAGLMLFLAGGVLAQSHDHMGHLNDSFADTPGKVGLVTILEQEAKVAADHAGYGKSNPSAHMPHVRNALDPKAEPNGPGKGYGVIRAAEAVIAHMDMARKAADASDGLKTHSEHVITSAKNVVMWAKQAMEKSKDTSAKSMDEIVQLTQWILNGRDANGDGKISWQEGEGGIAQLKQHLGFIEH
jgi:hypothetical protein